MIEGGRIKAIQKVVIMEREYLLWLVQSETMSLNKLSWQ